MAKIMDSDRNRKKFLSQGLAPFAEREAMALLWIADYSD